ncbi:relaxase/mobilization nuclease [Streptomyces uncialis]|uniref:relaxase/mobilization nuclease n=1 Tax=Streptomyces uncialis TaxID=1048205 RepID=UPI0022586F7F|nr:relaxase/mobilization nuclease [Streptomyces uncialis]
MWRRSLLAADALEEALGRPVVETEGRTSHTVLAHWNRLDYHTEGEQEGWTSVGWAEHLDDPTLEFPFTADARGNREPVFHLSVELHPGDRKLEPAEWKEIAHRFARASGIAPPGDEQACRWIAVQAQPGRLDLLASLIRLDGAWQNQPSQLPRHLAAEARRIEADLGLRTPHRPDEPDADARVNVADAGAHIGLVLRQPADETNGPLAMVRGFVEHSAHRLAELPRGYGPEAGQRLEWTARRLHALQQDLDVTAAALTRADRSAPRSSGSAARPPAARVHRSRT